MEQSDALRDYAISKLEKLSRYFDGIISIEVKMNVEKERRIVRLIAHLINSKILKSSAQSKDMYTSIDEAQSKLKRQLKKFKDKLQDKGRGETIRKSMVGEVEEQPQEESSGPEIVQTDIYFKKPMSPEEAAMQLESYEQEFLVFLNSTSDQLSIVYHRDDGTYGLIEPQI